MSKNETKKIKARFISHLRSHTPKEWRMKTQANSSWFIIFIYPPKGKRALASISYNADSGFLLLHFIRLAESQKAIIKSCLNSFDIQHFQN